MEVSNLNFTTALVNQDNILSELELLITPQMHVFKKFRHIFDEISQSTNTFPGDKFNGCLRKGHKFVPDLLIETTGENTNIDSIFKQLKKEICELLDKSTRRCLPWESMNRSANEAASRNDQLVAECKQFQKLLRRLYQLGLTLNSLQSAYSDNNLAVKLKALELNELDLIWKQLLHSCGQWLSDIQLIFGRNARLRCYINKATEISLHCRSFDLKANNGTEIDKLYQLEENLTKWITKIESWRSQTDTLCVEVAAGGGQRGASADMIGLRYRLSGLLHALIGQVASCHDHQRQVLLLSNTSMNNSETHDMEQPNVEPSSSFIFDDSTDISLSQHLNMHSTVIPSLAGDPEMEQRTQSPQRPHFIRNTSQEVVSSVSITVPIARKKNAITLENKQSRSAISASAQNDVGGHNIQKEKNIKNIANGNPASSKNQKDSVNPKSNNTSLNNGSYYNKSETEHDLYQHTSCDSLRIPESHTVPSNMSNHLDGTPFPGQAMEFLHSRMYSDMEPYIRSEDNTETNQTVEERESLTVATDYGGMRDCHTLASSSQWSRMSHTTESHNCANRTPIEDLIRPGTSNSAARSDFSNTSVKNHFCDENQGLEMPDILNNFKACISKRHTKWLGQNYLINFVFSPYDILFLSFMLIVWMMKPACQYPYSVPDVSVVWSDEAPY